MVKMFECGSLKSNGGIYEIVYHDTPHKYRVRFPKSKVRGPSQILKVKGTRIGKTDMEDITELYKEYNGPAKNFHGVPTSPNLLGFQMIEITFAHEVSKVFVNDEIITS